MNNPGVRLLQWWRNASPQSRMVAGIVLFSLICTAALMLITETNGAPASSGLLQPGAAAGGASGEAPLTGLAEPSPWFYVDAFLKLLFVLGLFIGAAVIARHYSGKKLFRDPSRQLEVVETVRLSPRQAMHLVRVGQRSLLIGATDQAFTTLADLGQDAAPAAATAPSPTAVSFASLMAQESALPVESARLAAQAKNSLVDNQAVICLDAAEVNPAASELGTAGKLRTSDSFQAALENAAGKVEDPSLLRRYA